MSDVRRHSAWFLLLVLLAGGMVAPVVHRSQHAAHEQEAREVRNEHLARHAHDRAAVEGHLPLVDELVCPPYHSLLQGLIQQPVAARLAVPRADDFVARASVFGTHRPSRFLIRGPPVG